MQEDSKLPPRGELEKDLNRLRELAEGIDKITLQMTAGKRTDDGIQQFIDRYVAEQSAIVDRFILYSQDYESLQRFTKIVEGIQNKIETLNSCEDSDIYDRLKTEIGQSIEEWTRCLNTIIDGVMKRAPR